MKLLSVFCFICISLVVGGCANNHIGTIQPLAVIQSKDQPTKVVSLRHHEMEVLVLDITPDDGRDRIDRLLALRFSAGGRLIAEHRFQSAYDIFRLELIDLNADNEPECVLISGEGHGTSVRREWLEVFDIYEGVFRQLLHTAYSDFFGSGASRWRYRHHYRNIDGDGHLELVLYLEHTPLGKGPGEHPEMIPAISMKAFRFQSLWNRARAQRSNEHEPPPRLSSDNQ